MTYGGIKLNADKAGFERFHSVDEMVVIIREKRNAESVLKALKAFSKEKVPNRIELFREILIDPQQSQAAKNVVVVELGTEHLPENQELLLKTLDTDNLQTFAKAVSSLGKIGNMQAIERLEHIKAPDDKIAKQKLAFAKSLLAYRLRINRHLIPPPSEIELVDVTNGSTFKAEKAEAEIVAKALKDAKEELPAFTLIDDGAEKLGCRSFNMMLVPTDVLQKPESLLTIRSQSALPVVLLKTGLGSDNYFLDTYFFTHPSNNPGEIEIIGMRPGGELVYAGKGSISSNGLDFRLKSVNTRYAPAIDVEGRYDPNNMSWKITKAISSTRVAAGEGSAHIPHRISRSIG